MNELEQRYDAIVEQELSLRAKLTGTAADEAIMQKLQALRREADALNAILDGEVKP